MAVQPAGRMKARFGTFAVGVSLALAASAAPPTGPPPAWSWPEAQRAFLEDGPGWLLSPEQRAELEALDEAGRETWIADFLATDPFPDTPENELTEAIRRRQALAYADNESPADVRFRLVFLNGTPQSRQIVDCGFAFKPLEVWRYAPTAEASRRSIAIQQAANPPGSRDPGLKAPRKFSGWEEGPRLVLYRPSQVAAWRLWDPFDGKKALYSSEMEYLLQQYEELRNLISGERFDVQVCKEAREVDNATGVMALTMFLRGRPVVDAIHAFLAPPADLAQWTRSALSGPSPGPAKPELTVAAPSFAFPRKSGALIATRMLLEVTADEVIKVGEDGKVHLLVEGSLESEGQPFAQGRIRYELDPPATGATLGLALDEALRPGAVLIGRFKIRDETGGAVARVAGVIRVPLEPRPEDAAQSYEGAVIQGERLAQEVAAAARDSLILAPPLDGQVALALYRAQALVTGVRIKKVAFSVDGVVQVTRAQPPWTAELRLATQPTEQLIKAVGFDENGEEVASDEIAINQPRGAFRVRILEPKKGQKTTGRIVARAEVVVPDERTVSRVELKVDEEVVATLEKPPWTAPIEVPRGEGTHYLTAVAYLDDGRQTEDVHFLNAPENLSEPEVRTVELYSTVSDRGGRLVKGLTQEDFQALEQGRPQKITKFELVENLSLVIGIAIDTSGSMSSSLAEAQEAGRTFLEQVVRSRDRCYVVAFSGKPTLAMPPTTDLGGCLSALDGLLAVGWTALHDALVTSLYYTREMEGQRALVLLSDGDDTASSIAFDDALEYARRSGVVIYPIGLNVGGLELGIHRKLGQLAQETGGRVFFIDRAEDLAGVYQQIEEELRSRYLIAYASDRPEGREYREVEVKVKKGGLKARTIRGYYP